MKEVFETLGIIAGTCICLTIFICSGIKHNRVKVIEWIKKLERVIFEQKEEQGNIERKEVINYGKNNKYYVGENK